MNFSQQILYNTFSFIAVPLALFLVKIILLLIAVAFFTLAERKIMGACHRRFGPNEVGSWGVLQPLADGLKLLAKELVVPSKSNYYLFFFAPILILTLSLLSWVVIPFALVNSLGALQSYYSPFDEYYFKDRVHQAGRKIYDMTCRAIKDGGVSGATAGGIVVVGAVVGVSIPTVVAGATIYGACVSGIITGANTGVICCCVSAGLTLCGIPVEPDTVSLFGTLGWFGSQWAINQVKTLLNETKTKEPTISNEMKEPTSPILEVPVESESESFFDAIFSTIGSMSYGLLFLLSILALVMIYIIYVMFLIWWSRASKHAGGLKAKKLVVPAVTYNADGVDVPAVGGDFGGIGAASATATLDNADTVAAPLHDLHPPGVPGWVPFVENIDDEGAFLLGVICLAAMVILLCVISDATDKSSKTSTSNEIKESTSPILEEHVESEPESFFYAVFSLISSMSYGLLFLLSISSAMAYIMFLGSWSSASKYAFLGGLRVIAQMVSYEVSMSTTIIPNSVASGTMNLTELVMQQQNTGWYARPLLPCLVIFLISMLAETNRAPFDLPEAESDLVSGYNTEYSSITFAMFFLGEYANMIQMGALVAILFLGGWEMGVLFTLVYLLRLAAALAFKNVASSFFFVLVRATYPRYRYDHLMTIGWTVFLPLTFAFLLFFIGILKMTDAFIYVHEIVPQIYYGGILF